jgi:uncharacterized protein (TIGR02270 family)
MDMSETPLRPTVAHVIPDVLRRHCQQAAFLWTLRRRYVARADVRLEDLADLDERLEAHLDGIRTAQSRGWKACREALAEAGDGEVFVACLMALESDPPRRFAPLLEAVAAQPAWWSGCTGALGWASTRDLQGVASKLLESGSPLHGRAGVAACAVHRVDPGPALARLCSNGDAATIARALRTAGELGRQDLRPQCLEHLASPDRGVRFWAAWSAVFLGDRDGALQALAELALDPQEAEAGPGAAPRRARALRTVLRAAPLEQSRQALARLSRLARGHPDPAWHRLLIAGVGWLGDAHYVPWLISEAADPALARLAGQSWVLITGASIEAHGLQAEQATPVDCAEDAGLPAPDARKLEAWWQAQGGRFAPGARLFLGSEPTADHCVSVLRAGGQPQRTLAAEALSLMRPGSLLFETRAPAWRQRRLLSQAS